MAEDEKSKERKIGEKERFEILLENINGKMDLMLEGREVTDNKIDRLEQKVDANKTELEKMIVESNKTLRDVIKGVETRLDKKIEDLSIQQQKTDKKIEDLSIQQQKTDKKIDDVKTELSQRIDKIDQKLEKVDKKIDKLDDKMTIRQDKIEEKVDLVHQKVFIGH